MDSLAHSRLLRLLPFRVLLHSRAPHARADDQARDLSAPIGQVDSTVTCSKQTQSRFERAVMMLHHMMYAQAKRRSGRLLPANPIVPWHSGVLP